MKSIAIALFASFALAFVASAQEASGTWTRKTQNIEGTWKIAGGELTLSGFSTKKAPDLKILLSPAPLSAITNDNATSGAKLIAKLKSPKGDQTYALPAGIDISTYKSIIIHCEKYSKLWGGASL